MNKKFFSITVLSLICFFSCISCTNEEDYSIVQEGHTRLEVATFNVNVLDDIQKYVNYRMAESADTRSLQNICYEPYTIAGDTALYIVNYADGWDVMSTDQRTPMVMMSSDSGHLDGRNLPYPLRAYIGSIANEIHQLKQIENVNNVIHPEWLKMPSKEDLHDTEKEGNTRDGLEPGVGYWELLYSITVGTPTVTESPKMTSTSWDQEDPWNYYIPYAADSAYYVGPAGCGAVASAQYLYYLHSKYGVPTSAVTSATINNANTHTFTFSNKTTTAWNNMALNGNGTTNAKRKSAMLIAYSADRIGTQYYKDGAYSSFNNDISFINSETGYHFYSANYDYNYVINQLLNNKAVLMRAEDTSTSDGHVFIADRIITTNTTYCDYYGWVGTTSTGESANYIDESNGHIIGYKIKKQEIVTRTTYSYKMNWGWGGDNDNVVCNPYSINDWFVTMNDGQQYHFNSGRKMARQ
ncbi:MAG: C10 family peptidase [Bacteroidaceae bacterium]|nr:C10 family peptidase [Bacteroidaceae bacterium]